MRSVLRITAVVSFAIALLTGCAGYRANDEYQTGLSLFKAEKYREAHDHALAAYREDPAQPAHMGLLGWTYLKQNNVAEAKQLFSRIEERDRNSVIGLQGLAWVDYIMHNYDSSEGRFKGQLAWAQALIDDWQFVHFGVPDRDYINSIASDAYYGLGLIASARGKTGEGKSLLLKALDYKNDFIGHGPIRSALGDAWFQEKDYKSAAVNYSRSLEEKNDNEVAAKLAWSLYSAGDIPGADRVFSGIVGTKNGRPGLYGLVFTRSALHKTGEAEQALRNLIRLDAYYADTEAMYGLIVQNKAWKMLWKDFASAYFEKGDFARAAYKLQGYLPLAGSDCEARLMEAWCTFYLTSLETSLRQFTTLRDKGCSTDQAETGRGVALLYLGRLDEADEALKKAYRLNKNNLRAILARGAVAFARGDHEEAIKIYNANLSSIPDTDPYFSWRSHALNNLGWSYIGTKRYGDALATFQRLKALHASPSFPQIFAGLGWSYFYLGRSNEARTAFEAALRLDPRYASALSGLSSVAGVSK